MVGGSSRIPKIISMVEKYFNGKKVSNAVDPDKAIAIGALRFATTMSGTSGEITVIDVTSLSLGIEVAGGKM